MGYFDLLTVCDAEASLWGVKGLGMKGLLTPYVNIGFVQGKMVAKGKFSAKLVLPSLIREN